MLFSLLNMLTSLLVLVLVLFLSFLLDLRLCVSPCPCICHLLFAMTIVLIHLSLFPSVCALRPRSPVLVRQYLHCFASMVVCRRVSLVCWWIRVQRTTSSIRSSLIHVVFPCRR